MQISQRRQASQQKRSIMDYLPENQRAKIIKLVERLGEETQIKEKFQALYQQEHQKYINLQRKYRQLEESYEELKSHMATSRMAINKAKQAYMASKSAKKIRKIQLQENEEDKYCPKTQNLKQTWLRIPKSIKNVQNHHKNQYVFQQNENSFRQQNSFVNTEPIVPFPLGLKTDQKSHRKMNIQNSNKNDLSISLSKKQQIMNLRKQIDMLSESMLKNQRKGMPIDEKVKKCNQIKKRYIKSKEKDHQKLNFDSQEEKIKAHQNQFGLQDDSDQENEISHRLTARTNKRQEKQQKSKNVRQLQSDEEEFHKTEVQKTKYINNSDTNQYEITNSKRLRSQKQNKFNNRESEESKNSKFSKNFQQQNHHQTTRSGKGQNKGQIESKFDESLFAIIDQLNSGI